MLLPSLLRQCCCPIARRASFTLLLGFVGTGTLHAQTVTSGGEKPAAPSADTVLPAVRAKANAEAPSGKEVIRATVTGIGKGRQPLRDIPQSVTVITEKLIDDRNVDTLKDALRNTAGIAFQAAEGGEEDIRLRGFSLQGSGDIFIDGVRDPAFYTRDSFNWDRLEVLRGSASMLFGRGSTGGAANQVTKQPMLLDVSEVAVTAGTGAYGRATGDFNVKTGDDAALRVNALWNRSDGYGAGIDRYGIAPTFRWGIGMRHEFSVGLYHLQSKDGIHYGLPWLTPGASGGDTLWPTNPRNYYGMASDYAESGTTQGSASHTFRLPGGAEWRTALRVARYTRDQRASAIRFAPAAAQPDGRTVTADSFGDATVLTRGTNNKTMNMNTWHVQSDYDGKHRLWGQQHAVQGGVDVANEDFENLAASLPAGIALTKPVTFVGTPDDGAAIDEGMRTLTVNRTFRARALGVYAQDLVQVAPVWKLLGGVRWDRLDGTYRNLATAATGAANACAVAPAAVIERRDSLFSKRAGVLFQPGEHQSYHFSYGTSFNTAGDTYQYDAGTANVDPESSRNLELGAKLDSPNGRVTLRTALFHSTKYNERNRDADTVTACNYVLSGKRHAAGFELDVAGRITPQWEIFASYAYIPIAKVDSSTGAAGTEPVGSRPGLTPRHSGTVWTTYKLDQSYRIGGGLNLRGKDKPVGLAPTSRIEAPGHVTVDLMAEYSAADFSIKVNLLNATDEHYADYLYRGHYVPGQPRTLQLSVSHSF